MKHGDLVALPGERRRWVALNVTRADLVRGVNVRAPGLHLFTGYWYGGSPLHHRGYGKVIAAQGSGGRVVGRLRGVLAARRQCR